MCSSHLFANYDGIQGYRRFNCAAREFTRMLCRNNGISMNQYFHLIFDLFPLNKVKIQSIRIWALKKGDIFSKNQNGFGCVCPRSFMRSLLQNL